MEKFDSDLEDLTTTLRKANVDEKDVRQIIFISNRYGYETTGQDAC